MKLIDQLVSRAAGDDRAMGALADQEEARLRREQAYTNLGRQFDQMAADGYIDKDELKSLMAQFRALGLDTKDLEKLADSLKNQDRVAVTSELRNSVDDELRSAKTSGRDPNFQFKVQALMADYNQCFEVASRVSKAEDDMYKVAIKNMVA